MFLTWWSNWLSDRPGRTGRPTRREITADLEDSPLATGDLTPLITYAEVDRDALLTELDPVLVDDMSQAILGRLDSHPEELPVFPPLVLPLIQFLERPDDQRSAAGLASLLHDEAALSAELLRIANSPIYPCRRELRTVEEAALRLGLDEMTQLAATLATRALFKDQAQRSIRRFREHWSRRWHSTQTCAASSSAIAKTLGRGDPITCFVGGLLGDLGRMLALRCCSRLLSQNNGPAPSLASMNAILNRCEQAMSCSAVEPWALPPIVGKLSRCHPSRAASDPQRDDLDVVRLVRGLYALCFDPLHPDSLPHELWKMSHRLSIDRSQLRDLTCILTRNAEIASSTSEGQI